MPDGSTIPFPTVLATWVPMTKAATKLKKAAQSTALVGDRTRVETTVAMELAASWKPLRKSKEMATRTMTPISAVWEVMAGLGVFQHNAFKNIRYVLAAVDGGFDSFVDFLPHNDLDCVFFLFK